MGRDICGWRDKIGIGEKSGIGENKKGMEKAKWG